jgi:hypothetical protein
MATRRIQGPKAKGPTAYFVVERLWVMEIHDEELCIFLQSLIDWFKLTYGTVSKHAKKSSYDIHVDLN